MFHEVINMESYLQKIKKSYYQNLAMKAYKIKPVSTSSETLILYENSYYCFSKESCDK